MVAAQAERLFDIELFVGSRSELLMLFEDADDSASEISTYMEKGEVLVACSGSLILGHVRLIAYTSEWEIKSLAVIACERGRGIGSALTSAALDRAFGSGATRVRVATATADVRNIRFYQLLGFRMQCVQRDAFDAARGYPALVVEGIPVRDRVWFSMDVNDLR